MTNEELTHKVFELDECAIRHGEQIKTLFTQLGEVRGIADGVHKLAKSVEVLAHEQKSTGERLDKVSDELKEIRDKPARRWESIVSVVITVIATALVTYALTRAGIT